MNAIDKPKRPPGVGSSAWLGRWESPVGRWMTFDEERAYMVNYPASVAMIWVRHKNNPRPSCSGRVLFVLETIAPLRHLIRYAQLQMARLRHAVIQSALVERLCQYLPLRRWLAYVNRPNDPSSATRRTEPGDNK